MNQQTQHKWEHGVACLLLLLAASTLAGATCAAPPKLRAPVESKPKAEGYSRLGNWFAGQKQFDCAAASFASALHLEPQSSSLAYLWGLSLFSAGHYERAIAALNQARQLGPADIRPHLVLGAVLDKLKKTPEAEAEWRAALAIDPDSTIALDSLTQDLLDQKDYPSVIAMLDKPGGSRTRSDLQSLNLGVAYSATGRLEDAVRVLREGLNTDPGSIPIGDELSVVLILQGRDNQAYAVLELTLDKHPDDRPTQLLYLRTLVSSNRICATSSSVASIAAEFAGVRLGAVWNLRKDGAKCRKRIHFVLSLCRPGRS